MTVIEKQNAEQQQAVPQKRTETVLRDLSDDYWEGELVPRDHPSAAVVSINPERVSGVACFVGTRVPLQILWDHLEEGPSIDDFLDGFEGVSREQAQAVLRMALRKLLESLPESTPWR